MTGRDPSIWFRNVLILAAIVFGPFLLLEITLERPYGDWSRLNHTVTLYPNESYVGFVPSRGFINLGLKTDGSVNLSCSTDRPKFVLEPHVKQFTIIKKGPIIKERIDLGKFHMNIQNKVSIQWNVSSTGPDTGDAGVQVSFGKRLLESGVNDKAINHLTYQVYTWVDINSKEYYGYRDWAPLEVSVNATNDIKIDLEVAILKRRYLIPQAENLCLKGTQLKQPRKKTANEIWFVLDNNDSSEGQERTIVKLKDTYDSWASWMHSIYNLVLRYTMVALIVGGPIFFIYILSGFGTGIINRLRNFEQLKHQQQQPEQALDHKV
jgi:hypothetical protein